MRNVIVLLAIFGLLVMVESKPALAAPPITTSSMTPNLPAFDGLQELVDLLSDNGIVTSPLDLALKGLELHLEGPEADGLFLPDGTNSCDVVTGVFFPAMPALPVRVCFRLVGISDFNTHIVLKQDTISMLTKTPRNFLGCEGEESLLCKTADTAIHELLHAMVARTACFTWVKFVEEGDESLVRDVTARIKAKVQISLLSDAGDDANASRLQALYGKSIANSLKTYPKGKACFEILGLVNTWSMFGHDPQRTWSSAFTGPTSSDLKWPNPFSDGGRFFSSVSVGMDGTIFAAGSTNDSDGILYALDPDKSVKWQYALNANLQRVSPAIGTDGTVYIGANGKLYAFLPDGTLRWDPLEFYPGWEVGISSPVIASDGLLYVTLGFAGGLEKLFAVDPDGSTPAERIKWAYYPPADINASGGPLTIGPDGTIYALFTRQPPSPPGTELVAIAPLSPSGSLKWRFRAGSGVLLSPPSIDQDGNLYVGASNGKLYALKPNGKKKWVKAIGGDLSFSTPAIDPDDGTLYVGSSNGNLYALNSANGKFKAGWNTPYQTGASLQTSPALGSNKVLYFTSFDGYSYAVKTDKTELFKILTGGVGAPPSIGLGDTVYFVGYQSVFAVGPDLSPPDTTITSGPTGAISVNTVTFTWTGSDDLTPTSGLEYASYLQGVQTTYSAFSTATTRSYANLPNGTYTFFVKARDQAGNEDPTPDSRTITIQAEGGGGGWGEF